MNCFHCNSTDTKVTDSRPTGDGKVRRRRHHCRNCGGRYSSLQIAVAHHLVGGNYADDTSEGSVWGRLIEVCLPKISVTTMCNELKARFHEDSQHRGHFE